jgi:hypothetical protein
MKRFTPAVCLSTIVLCGLFYCGDNPAVSQTAGPERRSGILLTIVEPDGKTPAHGAFVRLRKKTSQDVTGLKKRSGLDTLVQADKKGIAIIGISDTGSYIVEGSDADNNLFLIKSVQVNDTDSLMELPAVQLNPAGSVAGTLLLPQGGDPRKVFVLVLETERFAPVAQDGRFTIMNLAQGTYNIRLIPGLDEYGVVDTFGISVRPQDTTDLGTIIMPFIGIPAPPSVRIRYDTAWQTISLTWKQCDTSLIKGYVVYRKNLDSMGMPVRLTDRFLSDTMFSDSFCAEGATYSYYVACAAKNDEEGPRAAAEPVRICGYFSFDTSVALPPPLNQDERILEMKSGPDGRIYCVTEYRRFFITDTSLSSIKTVNDVDGLFIIKFSRIGVGANTLYLNSTSGCPNSSMVLLNKEGDFIKYGPSSFCSMYLAAFTLDSKEHLIGFGNFGTGSGYVDSMHVIDTSGALIRSWGGINAASETFYTPPKIDVDEMDNIFVCDQAGNRIQVFDSAGTLKSSLAMPGPIQDFCVMKNRGRIIVLYAAYLSMFTSSGTCIARNTITRYFGGQITAVATIGNVVLVCASDSTGRYGIVKFHIPVP